MQETGTCPECNSSAISAQENSGFKDLYKCESCGCLLKSIQPAKISKLAVAALIGFIVAAKLSSQFLDAPIFSLVFFVLAWVALSLQVFIGIKSLFAKRTFQKIIKP